MSPSSRAVCRAIILCVLRMTRAIPPEALAIIKHFEGCALKAYQCQAGKWTIGWGRTKNVIKGDVATQAQVDAWLIEDVRKAAAQIEQFIDVPLSDNQFAALVSFVYNVGANSLDKSTLRRLLNEGHYDLVPQQLVRWNKAGGQVSSGLVRRRDAEVRLWNGKPWKEKTK